jgi:four helix bundle protein
MGGYRSLKAYQKAFSLAVDIYNLTKRFPSEEKYSLISQIRKASRSVCANIVEGYKRRRYKNHYLSKLNDSEAENAETQFWLDFSLACHFIDDNTHDEYTSRNDEVARLVLYMINNPEKFC